MAKTKQRTAKPKKSAPNKGPESLTAKLRRKPIVRLATLWLVPYMLLLGFFFGSVMRNGTYLEIFPQEIALPILMHAVTALLIAMTIFWLPFLRTFLSKLLATLILAMFMLGFGDNLVAVSGVVRAVVPGLTIKDSTAVTSIFYLIILYTLAVLISLSIGKLVRKLKLQTKDVEVGIGVLVIFVFIFPALSVARILPSIVRQTSSHAPELVKGEGPQSSTDKPDIYYIVLDRYASADTLQNQFSFNNSEFINGLRNDNYFVNDTARANYPYTTMSIASTMNANYTNKQVEPYKDSKNQSTALYHNLIRQSSVVKALKAEGYRYYAIGSSYGATNKAPLSDRDYMWNFRLTLFGKTKKLRDIETIEFKKSPYYFLAQLSSVSWWPIKIAEQTGLDNIRDQFNTLNSISTSEQPGGRFIFAHILSPHEPFYFNADGSLASNGNPDNVDKTVKEKYVNQILFINQQMKTVTDNIRNSSNGQAVIIINADEGPYPQVMNSTFLKPTGYTDSNVETILTKEDMRGWSDDWLKMKFGILQAVHIPKASAEDLNNLSSVNVFRIILNRYFGYSLDYLPNCQLGITSGKSSEFNYGDITSKFRPDPDATCAALQSLRSE